MSNHKITYYDKEPYFYARCRCGFVTKEFIHKWQVEDEVKEHERFVDRIRAYLGTSKPTLKSQRDYYLEMSEDPNEPPANRRLWKMLADELTPRVRERRQPEQETLFPMEIRTNRRDTT